MNPATVSASAVRRSPKRSIRERASDSAPPDSSMTRPIMAPSAMMIEMWPRVLPMPVSMVLTRSAAGTPAASATPMLTTSRATNACTLNLSTSSRSSATPPPAMPSSAPVLTARSPGVRAG